MGRKYKVIFNGRLNTVLMEVLARLIKKKMLNHKGNVDSRNTKSMFHCTLSIMNQHRLLSIARRLYSELTVL